MARTTKNAISKDVRAARSALKAKGYTYHEAANHLGYSYGHLAQVLTGARVSGRLLRRIHGLPARANIA